MQRKIRVVIADDMDIAREGMQRILSFTDDIEVVGAGETVFHTIKLVRDKSPDILLLDLEWFEDKNAGIEVIKALVDLAPKTKIIAITIYPELIELAREAGAVTGMSKSVPKRQVLEAIQNVYSEPVIFSSKKAEIPLAEKPIEELTPRELDVLRLLVDGNMDKEIAKSLNISVATAKHHVSSILGKLQVPNRVAAVTTAYRMGLVGLDKN